MPLDLGREKLLRIVICEKELDGVHLSSRRKRVRWNTEMTGTTQHKVHARTYLLSGWDLSSEYNANLLLGYTSNVIVENRNYVLETQSMQMLLQRKTLFSRLRA